MFFLFLGLSHPGLDRNNAWMMFFNFWIFLLLFLEFSCLGRVGTEIGTKFFFFTFSVYLILVSIEILLEWCFYFILLGFVLFFLEFSCLGRVGKEFGTKIFSLFLGLSHLGLEWNNARMMFFNFLNFFSIFFGIFLPRLGRNGIWD